MNYPEPSPRAALGEWILAALLGANLAWTTFCLGGYLPQTMVWSWLLTGMALAVFFGVYAFSEQRLHPATWFLLPFLVYAAINAAWISPMPWLGWRDWLAWAQMSSVFVLVLNGIRHPAPRRFLIVVVVGLAVVGVVLAGYQRFIWPDWLPMGRRQAAQFIGRSGGFFGVPNSFAALLLLLIPATAALTLQRGAGAVQKILCGYLTVLFLIGLVLTISRGAWLALMGAVLIWPLFVRERSMEWRVTVSIAATAVLMAGATLLYFSNTRVKYRLNDLARDMGERSRPIVWKGAWELFTDAPVFGTGAGSFDVLFEKYRPESFRDKPERAHNEYLNTLSDYGLVGFVLLFGGVLAVAVQTVRSATRAEVRAFTAAYGGIDGSGVTRALAVGLLAFALAMTVDFHMKIPALGMLVAALGAECVLRCWPAPDDGGNYAAKPLVGLFGLFASVLLALALALPLYRGEAARLRGREAIDRLGRMAAPTAGQQREVLSAAGEALVEATVLHPANGQAWADRAYVAALWSRLSPGQTVQLGRDAEVFAREALSKSQRVPEFWIRLGVAQDVQGRWADGSLSMAQALRLAPKSATCWYYYAYHLSLVPAAHALSQAAVQTCLRLDPGFRPAMILQESLSSPRSGR